MYQAGTSRGKGRKERKEEASLEPKAPVFATSLASLFLEVSVVVSVFDFRFQQWMPKSKAKHPIKFAVVSKYGSSCQLRCCT